MNGRLFISAAWCTVLTLLAGVTDLLASPNADPAPEVNKLIQGALARSESFFSGRLHYRLTSGIPGNVFDDYAMRLSFSGSSWAMRTEGDRTNAMISHRGKYVRFMQTPQPDGRIRVTTSVVDEEESLHKHFPSPPTYAGTFWFPVTKQFVREHADKAQLKGTVEVNGVTAKLLEWKVPKADISKAFHAVNELTMEGGLLRLYVAPQLGYALPRIEHVGENDTVMASFDSKDFEAVAEGLFLPKECKLQYFDRKGPGYSVRFQISNIEKANQTIPDKDFVVQLPRDTEVFVRRDGKEVAFTVEEATGSLPVAGLDDVIALPSSSVFRRTWVWAVVTGAVVALVASGAVVLIRRRRRA